VINPQENTFKRVSLQKRRSDEELQRLAKTYDFKGGPRVPKEFIHVLEKIYTNYARSLTNMLSVRLGTPAGVRLDSISQMKYLDYMLLHHEQIATCIFTLQPMIEPLYLNIDAQLAFLCIDSICGGKINYQPINRSFTEVEKKLLGTLSEYFLSPLQQSVMDYFDAKYEITEMEYDLFSVGAITDHEKIIVVNLEVKVNKDHLFPISFIMPDQSMEAILERIRKRTIAGARNEKIDRENIVFLETQLKSSDVEMQILLGQASLSVSQLHEMKAGDVIKLDRRVQDLLPAVTQNVTNFYVQPGTHQGNKLAVQVVEVVD